MRRILVVDDLEQNRLVLTKMLQLLGYEVETAADGLEALAKLPLDIDLVLLDVMMPGIDGYEVARRIRADPAVRDLPVIMVTALDQREDRVRAVEAGASDFIAKPVDRTELRVRLDSQMQLKEAKDALKRHSQELEGKVEQRTAALRRALEEMAEAQRLTYAAQLDTIHRLVIAAGYKDFDTAEHIQRLSRLGTVLAEALHLPPGEIEVLRHAIPMHDVGKIGIPDAILLKPGRLTPEERGVMETHTTIGSRILAGSSSPLLQAGETIALTHHERWDGTGYPQKLAGEDIPLSGRLCALVDVYDALSSDRPYRAALPESETLALMREGRGTQFDPALFDLFLEQLARMREVRAEAPARAPV